MALPEFNNDNIKTKIDAIRQASEADKKKNIDEIRSDLRSYIKKNFALTPEQEHTLDSLPEDGMEEIGFGLAMALENNWDLAVGGIPSTNPEAKVQQTVTIGVANGSPYAAKTVSWWWC